MDFILCPSCQGEGQIKGKQCSSCRGEGVNSWFGGYALFWYKQPQGGELLACRMDRFLQIFFQVALILFGLLGLLSLTTIVFDLRSWSAYWSWFALENRTLLLVFWFSLLGDLYLYYSFQRIREEKEKIKPTSFIRGRTPPSSWPEINSLSARFRINVAEALSWEAEAIVYRAWQMAKKLNHRQVEPLHILAGSLKDADVTLLINRLGLNWSSLKNEISGRLNELERRDKGQGIAFSLAAKKAFLTAYQLAGEKERLSVGPLELLEALFYFDGPVKEIFYQLEIGLQEIKNVCLWIDTYSKLSQKSFQFSAEARLKPKKEMNRAYTAIATPNLDAYSQDLTQIAAQGYIPMCMNRKKEMDEIFRILESGNQGVLLVGQPGVGKKSIINGIVRRMVAEDVPEVLKDKRLVSLSLSRLVAGASRPGETERRIQLILQEIARSGNIVLFVRDIHNISGIRTTEGELDISEILAEAAKNMSFYVLATSNPREYKRLIEGRPLGEAFQRVNIKEPDKNATIQILEFKVAFIESRQQVYFSYPSLEEAVKLANRYLHERFLPEKAIHLLEEAATYVQGTKGKHSVVYKEDVAHLVSQKTGIPVTKVSKTESEKLLNLEEKIHSRIIDQNEAVDMVAQALRRARTELRSQERPIANLLFLGPTGVGKTELAKTVTDIYFGSRERMIRVDMSEYQTKGSVERLIGSETQGGQLTDHVKENPFSLLLLDEIEKAHPDILNIFLQVMDDGRLTDARGRMVDFTNLILIGTSNAGTDFIQEEIRKNTSVEKIQEILMREKLKSYFRPEFLNRFDGLIVFKPLSREDVRDITKLMLKQFSQRLEKKGIVLQVTDEAIVELSEKGYDPAFGARPLRRVIQNQVEDTLAKYLLEDKIKRGDTVILGQGGEIKIESGR